jgi:hypothetical protein
MKKKLKNLGEKKKQTNMKEKKNREKTTSKSFHMSITHFLYWTFKLDPKPLDTLIAP